MDTWNTAQARPLNSKHAVLQIRDTGTVMSHVSHGAAICKCLVGGLVITFIVGAMYNSRTHVSTASARPRIVSRIQSVPSPANPCITYRYEDPSGRNVPTRPFAVNCSLLSEIGFPITDFSHASVGKPDSFVFATGANDRYFHAAMDAIARVQTLFPNVTIYFWDLSEKRTAEQVKKEMLHQHPNIFWIDSSIRLESGDFEQSLNQATNSSRGVLMFSRTAHSIFATTHSTMYEYLPIEMKHSTRILMYQAGCVYIQLSEQLYKHVIRWWLLCALDQRCMAPTRDLRCNFTQGQPPDSHARYAKCHRYDQSALNILLANYFEYDDRRYLCRTKMLTVKRGSRGRETPYVCLMDGSKLPVVSEQYFV